MAEGHSIIRWARELAPLTGERLEVVELPRRWENRATALAGHHIDAIETRGKHLLLHLSDGQTIHCHAMMYGSWQVGKPGMRLRKQSRHARLRLRTSRVEAIFFHGPVVELLTPDELAAHHRLTSLGPDVMSTGFDREEVWRRLKRDGTREIGEAVLDQRLVAGIGNIYKSEGLFLAGIDPRRHAHTVTRHEIERLWEDLIPLMWQGAKTRAPLSTLPANLRQAGERYWVYRRHGKFCLRCGGAIVLMRQGELRRATYYCADCQR